MSGADDRRDAWKEYLAEEAVRGRQAARDFPFKLVETTGERALETWRALKAQQDGAPFVLGGPGDLYRIADRMALMREHGEAPKTVVAAADRVAFPGLLVAERVIAHKKAQTSRRAEREAGRSVFFDPGERWPPTGAWPQAPYEEEPLAVAAQWDFERDPDAPKPAKRIPLENVYVAILPDVDASDAPAHFLWGGWNDVPQSEMLVAALRSWRDNYGAELVGMSHDTWSILVDRPPVDRRRALTLARDMIALCPDLLGEVKTVEGQAALVLANHWWNFWWD